MILVIVWVMVWRCCFDCYAVSSVVLLDSLTVVRLDLVVGLTVSVLLLWLLL